VDIPALLTAVAATVAALAPIFKGDPGIRPVELVQLMQGAQAAASADKLTARDMITLFSDRDRQQAPPQTLVEQMQMLASVKQFAAELAPAAPGPQGASFWDALITLAGNTPLAEGLAKRISEGPPLQPLPRQVQVDSVRRPNDALPPPAQSKPIEVQFPPDFPERCKAIEEAADVPQRLSAVVEAIQSLRAIPNWIPFLQGVLEEVAQDDKPKAMRGISNWLGALAKNGLLTETTVATAIADFDAHFLLVREELLSRYPQLRPAAPPPPAVEGPPSPGSTPPEHVEVQTGPAPEPVEFADDPDVGAYADES